MSASIVGQSIIGMLDVANSIDKLIGSGVFCINDIRIRLGYDVIDEPWAWQHWMTRNYSSVDNALDGLDDKPATQPEVKEESETNEQNDE